MILMIACLAEEVTAHVDRQPAPAKARRILDFNCRNRSRSTWVLFDQLEQGSRSVKEPARIRGFDEDVIPGGPK